MISKAQRKTYRKTIGRYYTKRIRTYLEENNVLSKDGKPYADSTIWHVFNGRFENEAIEKAFIEVAKELEPTHLKTSASKI